MNPCVLPDELVKSPPFQYVAVSGLDISNNSFHATVWNSLSANRAANRRPFYFRMVCAENQFPQAKPRRTSFDQYQPRGLLKCNWMKKHLYEVPCVVVLFMDLDWDHPSFPEKRDECSSKVEALRHSLEGRSTRVSVVLIQRSPALPPGDDARAAERATELCTACDLTQRSLFVLPQQTDTVQLQGFIRKLEEAFYDLAIQYYQNEIKRRKTKRDTLNKEKFNHQMLIVRYQFKLGFLTEIKQDTHSALKHYKQAYSQLLEMHIPSKHLVEFKTVAAFLTYKICKHCFQHNTPLDAIGQYKRHIEFFKGRPGPIELDFEHSLWVSRQCSIFAELFDAAIQSGGLAPIQTQHPGFYFQSASQAAINSRNRSTRFSTGLPPYPTPDPLAISSESASGDNKTVYSGLEYYGQRPWRVGPTNYDGADDGLEKQGVVALQWRTAEADHSTEIISLLSSAMSHFKRHRCPRMKRFIMVELADEYIKLGDFEKAVQLLANTIWEYRGERWYLPLKEILLRALKCAYALGNVKDYVTVCFELLGPPIKLYKEERGRLHSNLQKVLFLSEPPTAEDDLAEEAVSSAKVVWQKFFTQRDSLMVAMHNIVTCVEAKATFIRAEVRSDKHVEVLVCVRQRSPGSMQFSRLTVHFTDPQYDQFCVVTTDGAGNLTFEPNQAKSFNFRFMPRVPVKANTGCHIEINALHLEISSPGAASPTTLHWQQGASLESLTYTGYITGGNRSTALASNVAPEYMVCNSFADPLDEVLVQPAVNVVLVSPRRPEMTIELRHSAPALIGEPYAVCVYVRNDEQTDATALTIQAVVVADGQTDTPGSALLCFSDHPQRHWSTDAIEHIDHSVAVGDVIERTLVMSNTETGTKFLKVEVSYNINVEIDGKMETCKSLWTESLELRVIHPLSIATQYTTLRFEPVEALARREFSILSATIRCQSASPLVLHNVSFQLNESFRDENREKPDAAELKDVTLKSDMCAVTCVSLVPHEASQNPKSVGSLQVEWSRASDVESTPVNTTALSLAEITVVDCPLVVASEFPAFGVAREPLTLSFLLHNTTYNMLELDVSIVPSDAFMFCGQKQTQLQILPNSYLRLQYILLPLCAGQEMLPELKLSVKGYADDLLQTYAQRNVPRRMHVLPARVDSTINNTAVPAAQPQTQQA